MNSEKDLAESIAAIAEDYRKLQAPAYLHSAIMQKVVQEKPVALLGKLSLPSIALATCALALLIINTQRPMVDHQFDHQLPKWEGSLPSFSAFSSPSMATVRSIALRTPGSIPTLGSVKLRFPKIRGSIITEKSEALLNDINNYSRVVVYT